MSESRPSLAASVSRTAARVRSRGLGEVSATVWGHLRDLLRSEGHLKLMVRDAGGDAPERDDVSFRRATPSDGIAYERDIGTDADSTFRARLTPTTRCYLVEGEGKLLHASWVTTSRAWTAEISGSISPPPGDAYVYESFTRAEARGRGIYPFALSSMCADLGAEGARRVWVGVEADNVPSIRAISKAGFTEAFELHFSRRLGRIRVKAVSGPEARVASVLLSRTEG